MKKRINFFGPPGCGKSTISTRVFSDLKKDGYNVEYCPEYIKQWAYMKRVPQGYEGLYVFAKQLHSEDVCLRHGVDVVLSDSPMAMNWAYCDIYNSPVADQLKQIVAKWETTYPAVNIWINRTHGAYSQIGRYETEEESAQRAIQLKERILSQISLVEFDSTDLSGIYDYIKVNLND